MKNLILLLILLALISGCRSTKKLTDSSATTISKTETVQKADVQEQTKVSTDKKAYKKTTITKTVYDTQTKPSDVSNQPTPGIEPEKDNGTVVSTEVTVIEEGSADNSKIETKKSDNSQIATKTEDSSKAETKVVEKATKPVPWGWIFGILVIVAGAFIYLKRSKVFPWIKSVLSPAGKNQKI